MNRDFQGSYRQQQSSKERKKKDDSQASQSFTSHLKQNRVLEEEEYRNQQMISQQIYYKSSGLTNFMILDQIKKDVPFPASKIKVDFRNVFLNSAMRSFFVKDLEKKSPNINDFAFNFQNMFYTKILYSGMFNNVYCAYNLQSDGVFNVRFDTDVMDSYRLRILRPEKSKTRRFCRLGGQAELNGVFGFCEKISYQADIALLFDNQLRHSAKYEVSLPFLGDFGSLRANVGVVKRRIDDSLQYKRRRKKIMFFPFEWQNTYLSYSYNSLTFSHFEPFTSDSQRLYFLSMDYGINRIFRNKYARQFFNEINDAAFLNNRLVSKDYFTQHEAKIAYTIPEQRFQIKQGALLKYSYSLNNKIFLSNNLGLKSILKTKVTYFEKKKYLLTSSLETGMQVSFDIGNEIQSRSSLEGSSNGTGLSSTLEESLPQQPNLNFNFNSFQLQNVPGYYQLFRDNKNLSFYFALRNKLYLRKLNFYGFKPFIHANFYSGNSPCQPVINCGVGLSRHFGIIDSKVDFLINSPNFLQPKSTQDNEFSKLQIVFNP